MMQYWRCTPKEVVSSVAELHMHRPVEVPAVAVPNEDSMLGTAAGSAAAAAGQVLVHTHSWVETDNSCTQIGRAHV